MPGNTRVATSCGTALPELCALFRSHRESARLPSGGILTVVVPRDELAHLTLEFRTFTAEAPTPRPRTPRPAAATPATIPANPWPHDMVITVDDSSVLLELLWIREAWQLNPVGDDLPPVLVETPARVSASDRQTAPIAEWEAAWPRMWRECLQHAGTPRDPQEFERMSGAPPGPERAALIKKMVGPSWDDQVGRDAFTEDYGRWQQLLGERRVARMRQPLDEHPERVALDALIPACQAGLTTIVELPCRGVFTRVIGPHTLLVTAATRADPDAYRSALSTFR